MGKGSKKGSTLSFEVPLANPHFASCVARSSRTHTKVNQSARPVEIKKEPTPTRITRARTRSGAKKSLVYSMVVDLEASLGMDDPSTHPDLEVLNIDDANDTQVQVDNLANPTTTLVVRSEKETAAGFDETYVCTGPQWL